MKKKIAISVIIPVYNGERTIARALSSVIEQTRYDLITEIIVVNDGSIDQTAEIVKSFQQSSNTKIKLYTKENAGVSSTRNYGLKMATGNWIGLLDADDSWLPQKIERQVDIIMERDDIDFLGVAITDQPLKLPFKKVDKLYKASLSDLFFKVFPQTSTALFRASIVAIVGYYNEEQSHGEDANYFMRICDQFNYYYLQEKLVDYDNGKLGFGVSGLSSNLKEMHRGSIYNIKFFYSEKKMSLKLYLFLRCFYQLKYFRRIFLTNVNKKRIMG